MPDLTKTLSSCVPEAAFLAENSADAPLIIMIDDNPEDLILAELLLQKILGHTQIRSFTSGSLFLEKEFGSIEPDMIMIDMHMPDISGIHLLQRIRKEFFWTDVPILLVTGNENETLRTEIFNHGANGLLPKVMGLDDMHAQWSPVIQNCLKQQEAI